MSVKRDLPVPRGGRGVGPCPSKENRENLTSWIAMHAPALEDFALQVVGCRRCEIGGYLTTANPIRPALIEDARMMLIGQAPGPVTDRKGYHLAGPAGHFLDVWLQRAGFPPGYFRAHVYLTSLTRCFPGKSLAGNGDRPP